MSSIFSKLGLGFELVHIDPVLPGFLDVRIVKQRQSGKTETLFHGPALGYLVVAAAKGLDKFPGCISAARVFRCLLGHAVELGESQGAVLGTGHGDHVELTAQGGRGTVHSRQHVVVHYGKGMVSRVHGDVYPGFVGGAEIHDFVLDLGILDPLQLLESLGVGIVEQGFQIVVEHVAAAAVYLGDECRQEVGQGGGILVGERMLHAIGFQLQAGL